MYINISMRFLIPIIVFLGFIAGYLLKKYIPEEQKDAKPYLYWAEKILLLILISFLLYTSFSFSFVLVLLLILGILVGLRVKELYLYLGFALLSLELVSVVLAFIFGMVKGQKKHMLRTAVFFFLPFLLLLTTIPFAYTESFALGGLIAMLISKQ